jgi:phosphoribosylformylglycinamidine synthase
MLSESQERMLVVLQKGKEQVAERIFKKWALDFAVIGEVRDTDRINIFENGKSIVDLPINLITNDAPVYKRPYRKPDYLRRAQGFKISSIPAPNDLDEVFLNLISSPNLSSKRWIYEQYDHMVRSNTVVLPGSDAAVVRIKGTTKAVALTSNCNSRYCYLNPFAGSVIAVAESARNLACSGAVPLAITDCLNFGNPEKPEIMWQFKESIEGMSKAATVLGTPIVSGNVSFYNETENKGIYPTPTVAMVGLIEDVGKHVTQWLKKEGDILVLLGQTKEELGGSEYLKTVHGQVCGPLPQIDLDAESRLIGSLIEAAQARIMSSAHDISEGGLATAIAESCFTPKGPIGVKIKSLYGKIREDVVLFGESQSRAIVSLDKNDIHKLEKIASNHGIPIELIGIVGGDRLSIEGLIDVPILKAYHSWAFGFEETLKGEILATKAQGLGE